MKFSFHGRCSIQAALKIEQDLIQSADQAVCGFEFDPVITLGVRAVLATDVHLQGSVDVVRVDRGGQATLHGPGQLVIFPVVQLKALQLSVHDFVASLSKITSGALSDMGVATHTKKGAPGLYTETGKIAFFGLRIRDGYATHGLAINVSNDLKVFRHIRSCGVQGATIDSLRNRGVQVGLETLFSLWMAHANTVWALDVDSSQHYVSKSLIPERSVGAVGSAFP